MKPKSPGAPAGNRNARKPESEKIFGKGRTLVDFGLNLRARIDSAVARSGGSVSDWLRSAAREKLGREESGEDKARAEIAEKLRG